MEKITRRNFMQQAAATTAAAALMAGAPSVIGNSKKRNLIFILTDDHRPDFMSATGHPFVKTPHLDRMIGDGVYFENSFCTTPVCGPSRWTCLTGQYGHRTGKMNNQLGILPGLVTFPEILQKQGIHTGYVGVKSQSDKGYSEYVHFKGAGYFDPEVRLNGAYTRVKGYTADIINEESEKFIRRNAKKPFCMFVSSTCGSMSARLCPRYSDSEQNVTLT